MKTLAVALSALALAAAASPVPAAEVARPAAAVPTRTPTVLITGTNRGIGLEFARLYAERGWKVIATARDPDKATELRAIAAKHANLVIEPLDVANNDQVKALAQKYQGEPIDVLLNNAGLLGEPEKQSLGKTLDYPTFQEVMWINAYAPLFIAQSFLPNVVASDQKKIVSITSGISSLASATRFGGLDFYRMSKAALNMGMRTLQAETRSKGVRVGILAPGEVETHMLRESGFGGRGLQPADSAAAVIKLIDNINDQEARFLVYSGDVVPW